MTTATGTVTHPIQLTERINRIEPSATMAAVAEAEKLRQQGIDVVDMTAGEPHFMTPEHIKEAAIAAIRANFSRYTPVGGTTELKDAIIQRHAADFGSDYKREETCASVGGKHALFNVISVSGRSRRRSDSSRALLGFIQGYGALRRRDVRLLKADETQGFRVTAQMIERLITPKRSSSF